MPAGEQVRIEAQWQFDGARVWRLFARGKELARVTLRNVEHSVWWAEIGSAVYPCFRDAETAKLYVASYLGGELEDGRDAQEVFCEAKVDMRRFVS